MLIICKIYIADVLWYEDKWSILAPPPLSLLEAIIMPSAILRGVSTVLFNFRQTLSRS